MIFLTCLFVIPWFNIYTIKMFFKHFCLKFVMKCQFNKLNSKSCTISICVITILHSIKLKIVYVQTRG